MVSVPARDALAARLYDPGRGVDPHGPPLGAAETRRLLDAVADARFAEDAPPFASPLADGEARNDRVPVQFLHESSRGGRWAVIAPPYGSLSPTGDPGLYAMHAWILAREGFGVALLPLPFHGARGFEGRPSGWGAVRADLGRTSRTIAQGAADAAALARHLRERRGASSVVGVGISWGGPAVGLAAALARGAFDALGLVAAVDNPVGFYWTGTSRAFRRVELARGGYREREVAEAFRPFAPSSHPAPFPGERATFAIPTFDGTVKPSSQEAWRRAWGGRAVPARGLGHVAAVVSPVVAARVARALSRSLP